MPLTNFSKDGMLDGTYTPPSHVAIFNGDPTGAGVEIDRVAIAWNAAVAGVKEQSAAPVLDVPAGQTVNYVGYFDAAAGGNLLIYAAVTPEVYANAGVYQVNSSAHNLNA